MVTALATVLGATNSLATLTVGSLKFFTNLRLSQLLQPFVRDGERIRLCIGNTHKIKNQHKYLSVHANIKFFSLISANNHTYPKMDEDCTYGRSVL